MKVETKVLERTTNYESIEFNKKTVEKVPERVVNTHNEVASNDNANEKKEINLENAVNKINKHLEATNTKIKFKIHESDHSMNNKVSIKIVDEENEKVIAEIPSEDAIEFSEKMHEIIGVLFDASK